MSLVGRDTFSTFKNQGWRNRLEAARVRALLCLSEKALMRWSEQHGTTDKWLVGPRALVACLDLFGQFDSCQL
jgi:hypothetical protein